MAWICPSHPLISELICGCNFAFSLASQLSLCPSSFSSIFYSFLYSIFLSFFLSLSFNQCVFLPMHFARVYTRPYHLPSPFLQPYHSSLTSRACSDHADVGGLVHYVFPYDLKWFTIKLKCIAEPKCWPIAVFIINAQLLSKQIILN